MNGTNIGAGAMMKQEGCGPCAWLRRTANRVPVFRKLMIARAEKLVTQDQEMRRRMELLKSAIKTWEIAKRKHDNHPKDHLNTFFEYYSVHTGPAGLGMMIVDIDKRISHTEREKMKISRALKSMVAGYLELPTGSVRCSSVGKLFRLYLNIANELSAIRKSANAAHNEAASIKLDDEWLVQKLEKAQINYETCYMETEQCVRVLEKGSVGLFFGKEADGIRLILSQTQKELEGARNFLGFLDLVDGGIIRDPVGLEEAVKKQ